MYEKADEHKVITTCLEKHTVCKLAPVRTVTLYCRCINILCNISNVWTSSPRDVRLDKKNVIVVDVILSY